MKIFSLFAEKKSFGVYSLHAVGVKFLFNESVETDYRTM